MASLLGTTVLYVLPDGPRKGENRPASIVRDNGDGTYQLQVFTDGEDDSWNDVASAKTVKGNGDYSNSEPYARGIVRRSRVIQDPGGGAGTWHAII